MIYFVLLATCLEIIHGFQIFQFRSKHLSTRSFSDRVSIGNLNVSSVGVGTIAWSKYIGKNEQNAIEDIIEHSVENGCDFFDTAERYGSGLQESLGGGWGSGEKIFKKFQENNIKVATKFTPVPWRLDSDSVVNACEASRQRLGIGSIDLYQIHFPDIVQPFQGFFKIKNKKDEKYWDGLIECYKRGIVKNVGVSNYGPTLLLRAHEYLSRKSVPLASNQINYSLLYRKNGAQATLDLGTCMGIRTISYYPLAMGLLTGKHNSDFCLKSQILNKETSKTNLELSDLRAIKYQNIYPLLKKLDEIAGERNKTVSQVALNFIVCKGAIPIPGARNVRQLSENLGARTWRLTAKEIYELEGIADYMDISFEGITCYTFRKVTIISILLFVIPLKELDSNDQAQNLLVMDSRNGL